jgi:hypothetical protein
MIVSEDEPTPNRAQYPKAPDREVESLGPVDRVHGVENPAYNRAVFVDHNPTNTPGQGCAVFLHCTDSDPVTQGCIAIAEDTLAEVMVWLDSARSPYLSVLVEDD